MEMGLKKVLIITSSFPPEGGGGVRRVLGFVKHLPACGWRPIILVPDKKQALLRDSQTGVQEDDIERVEYFDLRSLINRLEQKLPVAAPDNKGPFSAYLTANKTGVYPWLRKWLLIPDEMICWLRPAKKAADEMVSRYSPDAILSIGPSHVSHLVGLHCHRKYSIPWLADFKDPWTGNPFVQFASPLHKLLNRFWEKRVLKNCQAVMTVSENISLDLQGIEKSKQPMVVPNGYDECDYVDIQCESEMRLPLRIIHAGMLYGARTPHDFFQVVGIMKEQGIGPDQLQITFLGGAEEQTRLMAKAVQVEEYIEVLGHVPHREALEMIGRKDVCLLIPGPGKGTITGKVFEYLALNKPVLSIGGKNGDLEKLLVSISGITPYSNGDHQGIAEHLRSMIEEKKTNGLLSAAIDRELLYEFERGRQTRRVSGLLHQICERL